MESFDAFADFTFSFGTLNIEMSSYGVMRNGYGASDPSIAAYQSSAPIIGSYRFTATASPLPPLPTPLPASGVVLTAALAMLGAFRARYHVGAPVGSRPAPDRAI